MGQDRAQRRRVERVPREEVHLPLSDLRPASSCCDLNVVAEPDSEAVGQHGEHPLEVLLLRVRGESQVVQLQRFPVSRLPQDVRAVVSSAVSFQEPDV